MHSAYDAPLFGERTKQVSLNLFVWFIQCFLTVPFFLHIATYVDMGHRYFCLRIHSSTFDFHRQCAYCLCYSFLMLLG